MARASKSNKAKNTQIDEVSDIQEVKDILDTPYTVKQSVNESDNEEVKNSIKSDEEVISSDEFIDDLEKTPVVASEVKIEEKALVVEEKEVTAEKVNQDKSIPAVQEKRYYTEDLDKQGSIKIGNKIYSKPSVNTLAI